MVVVVVVFDFVVEKRVVLEGEGVEGHQQVLIVVVVLVVLLW